MPVVPLIWYAVCDGCGCSSPAATQQHLALHNAFWAGWRREGDAVYCRACQQARAAPGPDGKAPVANREGG